MSQTKEDVISTILQTLEPYFEAKGYTRKKNTLYLHDDADNLFEYEVFLSKRSGYFTLHLRLQTYNKPLMLQVNAVLEKVWLDQNYTYPVTWDEQTIQKSIKLWMKQYAVCYLTDWRCFKEENESLPEFNKRFSIWLCSFNELEEINQWQAQLIESFSFAEKWFTNTRSEQWIIENTDYPALYLLKKANRLIELNQKYDAILPKARDKEEMILFFKYLTQP